MAEKNIVILMPAAWSVRNVADSGVLRLLIDAGINVHLVMTEIPDETQLANSDLRLATTRQQMITPPTKRSFPDLDGVIKSAYHQHHRTQTYPLLRRWFERNYTPWQRFRATIMNFLGWVGKFSFTYRLVRAYPEWHWRFTRNLEPVREQLRGLDADLVWSTANIATDEAPYILAAQDLRTPTVTSILSFDNLTTRTVLPVYDHYMVWNQRMKSEVQRFYAQVPSEKITITGTPQFDFHLRDDLKWSREETLAYLGVSPDAQYFLYATRIYELGPEEDQLVRQIAEYIQADPVLKDYWLVVRIHPLDSPERWEATLAGLDNIVITSAMKHSVNVNYWGMMYLEQQAWLVNSLAHTEAVLNISSTITLDAAILNKPAICIDFSNEPQSARDIYYQEHYADHYRPIIESGGVSTVHDWAELVDAMHRVLENPDFNKSARNEMVRQECGLIDGQAAQRISETLLDLLQTRN